MITLMSGMAATSLLFISIPSLQDRNDFDDSLVFQGPIDHPPIAGSITKQPFERSGQRSYTGSEQRIFFHGCKAVIELLLG
jgi:hypothetical protein